MEKKNKFYVLFVTIIFACLVAVCWLKPADDFSATERRKLEQFPAISLQTIVNGSFMQNFEEYTIDQFPMRDEFRSLKAMIHFYIYGQSDNNDVYMVDGYVSKLDPELSDKAVNNAANKFTSIYNTYMAGTDVSVYYALIPDKNMFLAADNGYLTYTYEEMETLLTSKLSNMTYIPIADLLTVEDFYYTDTHWRQDAILDVAQKLAKEMGVELNAKYEAITLDTPFYGVYYGQLALPIAPDTITYMNHPSFENCTIINHENGKEIPMYDMNLAVGRDPYEMYLSGSLPVITIENPNASTDKELVIFRDSFGSSLAPLFVEGYSKITILDARYLNEKMIGSFVEFTNQDVLFINSTSVINNETAFH